jgi:oxidase EvaA
LVDSEAHCLVEAKFEPGNYAKVLISPSLQVTYSNFFQAHGGRKPKYSEFFDGSRQDVTVLYSHWMPEDGGRFYLKRVK